MKKPLLITFSIIILLIAALFIFQNIQPVELSFLFWTFERSLALMTTLYFLLGALFSFVLMLPSWFGKKKMTKQYDKKINVLMNEKIELTDKLSNLKQENQQLKQQNTSSKGSDDSNMPTSFDPIK